ncbi:MAG: sulfur carrier protein ThiS [Candidatus Methanomethylophilaceae archaeon]|nr:sulfur carrier protein ThiS [Candidatus Methanomethylophilaceae archaeon]
MRANGKEIMVREGTTLHEFLVSAGYDTSRVAVELNGSVSPKKTYKEEMLKDTDHIEIVSFVGGG